MPGARWPTIAALLAVALSAALETSAQTIASPPPVDTLRSPEGDVLITPILHASLQVEHGSTVVHVDPWSRGDYSNAEPADLILVTDTPGDHLDPDAIEVLRSATGSVVVPPVAADSVPDATVLADGETVTLQGVTVEAIPSYDLTPGEPFHPRGRGNGYVVTLGVTRLYVSGGGLECVPEVQALENIEVAFLSMNLPQGRMTPRAAAECVEAFRPRIVYPYHYRDADLGEFEAALSGSGIEVRLARWYPDGATVPF